MRLPAKTLRVTPAMEAGLTHHVWSIEELAALISAMETPGATNFNLETLVRLASAFKVGMLVRFVPFSEMLRWENGFAPDSFSVTTIDNDSSFISPAIASGLQADTLGAITPETSADTVSQPLEANKIQAERVMPMASGRPAEEDGLGVLGSIQEIQAGRRAS